MKKNLLLLLGWLYLLNASAQLYFPPKFSATWDTVNPTSLGWCADKLDTLANFLDQHNTKAFIILKDGRIAYEKYFGTFTQDSIWYWASAGKSLHAFLMGIAQEQGAFSLDDTVSHYLGGGWTSCTTANEEKITIRHLLTMASGLDDGVSDPFCTLPACLSCLAIPGTRWAYHNAPYTLSHAVLENATNLTLQQFTNQNLLLQTGIVGFWFTDVYNEIFASRARDMARFGLLILNRGVWANDTLLHDTTYFHNMVNTSQAHNLSYGYLWWLNGKSSFMLPQSQLVFPGWLIPNAPEDTWCALGKNDQKLYVSQSSGLVVVRLGNDAGNGGLAPTSFDDDLWAEINKVICTNIGLNESVTSPFASITTNSNESAIIITHEEKLVTYRIFDFKGQEVTTGKSAETVTNIPIKPGIYVVYVTTANGEYLVEKVIIGF